MAQFSRGGVIQGGAEKEERHHRGSGMRFEKRFRADSALEETAVLTRRVEAKLGEEGRGYRDGMSDRS